MKQLQEVKNKCDQQEKALLERIQETNDFNPAPTDLAAFRSFGLIEGDAREQRFRLCLIVDDDRRDGPQPAPP